MSILNKVLPNSLESVIDQKDYLAIIDFAVNHLENNFNISELEDGILKCSDSEGNEYFTNFDNLVKNIINEERKDWKLKISEYLDKLLINNKPENKIEYLFETSKQNLTIRLKPEGSFVGEPYESALKTSIYRQYIPNTFSFLALDLPDTFHILTKDEISDWEISENQLFEIAFLNLSNKINQIDIKTNKFDEASILTLFDRDYSAAFCIDFANNCSDLLGEFGSIISFPTTGSVFVHPINNISEFQITFNKLAELTIKFFSEDPAPISWEIYWFFNNNYEVFPTILENGNLTYSIPNSLNNLLFP